MSDGQEQLELDLPDSGPADDGGAAAAASAEREAKLFGWVPQEDFRGPAERWKTAEDFLEEGKRVNGFLKKDMQKLREELARRDGDVAALRQTMAEFAAFHQETERKAYDRARAELRDERKAALREGDGERVVEIEERIEQLEEAAQPQRQAPASRPDPGADPVWQGWVAENQWFAKNTKLRAITNGYGDILRAEHPELVGRPFLDEVKRRVQEDFPERFEVEARGRPAAVGGAGEARRTAGGRGYSALPADAKAACDKFVKEGLVPSREAYAKDYFGE